MSVRLGLLSVLGVALVACSGSKESEEAEATTESEKPVLTVEVEETPIFFAADELNSIIAREAVHTWAKAWHGQTLIEPIPIFYGDITGDGDPEALAFVTSKTGSSEKVEALLFSKRGETFWLDQVLGQITGTDPRNVRFLNGELKLTTSLAAGERDWTFPIN